MVLIIGVQTDLSPNPVPTSVVQRYVTDAAEIISSSQAFRKMFITEVFKRCNEVAKEERDSGKTSPELLRSPPPSRRLPNYVVYANYSDESFIPAKQTESLDTMKVQLIENYAITKTSSTTSGSTSTMTDSTATGDSSTTTTAEPTE